MKLLAKMLLLVAEKFKDTPDRQGLPYMLHCLYVMYNCGSNKENDMCIALGHDLMEDTDVTYEYLVKEFNHNIADGIQVLSHIDNSMSYEQYIEKVAEYQQLRPIKMADLEHNTHITRLKGVSQSDIERVEKYHRAYTYLKSKN